MTQFFLVFLGKYMLLEEVERAGLLLSQIGECQQLHSFSKFQRSACLETPIDSPVDSSHLSSKRIGT